MLTIGQEGQGDLQSQGRHSTGTRKTVLSPKIFEWNDFTTFS